MGLGAGMIRHAPSRGDLRPPVLRRERFETTRDARPLRHPAEISMAIRRTFPVLAFLIAALAPLGVPAADPPAAPRPVVVGYLPEYKVDGWKPDRLGAVTDLVYFGLALNGPSALPLPPLPEGVAERLKELRKLGSRRILVCVGGWDRSTAFPRITADKTERAAFIQALAAYCRTNGFDGVDYDWEHPEGPDQLASLTTLLRETREAFADDKRLVTMAVPAWLDLPEEAYRAVDRVHLMSYDQPFPQSTVEQLEKDIERLTARGCPPEKLVAGVPFYGRNAKGDARTYGELMSKSPRTATGDVIDGYAFNSPATIRRKLQLIQDKELGGVMFWEITQDSASPETSLLEVIRNELSRDRAPSRTR